MADYRTETRNLMRSHTLELSERDIQVIAMCIELFETHDEGWGAYCDTGDDTDWACRSDCTRHGIDRVRRYFGIL